MTAPVLADALGPRARRRMAIISVVAGAVVAGAVLAAILRLADKGQFDARLWEPYTRWPVWRFLLTGLRATLQAAALAMVLAIVVGAVMALGRLARTAPLRWLAGAYVEFFRAVPLLLLIYFSFNGLPKYGVKLEPLWYLVLALTAYNGAVLSEIFRAGILSLDRGQSEAAYAIGLGYWQAMLSVVIPQAARRMLPAIISQLVTLLKDTSLGFIVVYPELLRLARRTGSAYGNLLQSYVVAALIYFAVNFLLSRLAVHLEVRQRRRYGAGAIAVTGVEDLTVLGAQGAPRRDL